MFFNLTNFYSLFRLLIVTKNTLWFRLEQRSLIRSLVADVCKTYEIFRRICDVFGEANFRQKYLPWAKHGFITRALGKKKYYSMEWKHTDFVNEEKVPVTVVCKEGHADCFQKHERIYQY